MAIDRSDIIAAYRELLGREPESEAAIADKLRHRTGLELHAEIRASAEYGERRRRLDGLARLGQPIPVVTGSATRRVLLFGAYGNGNLGDQAQAAALARLLVAALPAGTLIAATSWESRAAYDPTGGLARGAGLIMDPVGLAEFDSLVIGGGGMLGPSPFPLTEPAWVAFLRGSGLRYGFAGIGVVPEATSPHPGLRDLFAGAAFVGLRDTAAPWLGEAMAGQPAPWFEMPDPVLAAGLLSGGAPAPPDRCCDTLLILKRPASGHAEEAALFTEAARLAAAVPGRCRTVLLEPLEDAAALSGFPGGAEAMRHFDQLVAACRGARRILSMRYHGVIAAALAGRPVLGGTAPKAAFLAGEIGSPDAALWRAADLTDRLAALPEASPRPEALNRLRAVSREAVARIAAAIAG